MKHRLFQFFFYLMILLYIGAGINHFVNPEFYEKMMPFYMPFPSFCVIFSGVCEVVFAFLLVSKKTRRLGAWLIVMMLVVFFIIHIQMLMDYLNTANAMIWIAIIRIPAQFVLIWWAHLYTKNPQPKS